MATVSIILPAYNAESHLMEAIQSVCSQTFSDWELIIVDDASIDSTIDIARKMALEDSRIILLHHTRNLGVSATRNDGLDVAAGNYIAFLDSDDIWHSDKLRQQIDALEKTQRDLCFTAYTIIQTNGNPVMRYHVPTNVDYNKLLKENVIGCSTVMLRRNCIEHLRFSEGFFHEDYVLWLQILKNGYKATGLNELLVNYRMGGRSNNKLHAAKRRWRIYRKCERLSFFCSCYYFLFYCWEGLKKHIQIKYTHSII